jgi:hypothetical protein
VSISSDNDPGSTEKLYGEYDSELDPTVDMCMRDDDVDAPDGVDLNDDVDMERDGDDDEEEDEEKEDEKVVEEEEEHEEEEDEDEDEDDSKEPPTIGQGEMVNTSADDADTIVHDEPTVLPAQGKEMHEHTPRPQPQLPAPGPQTPEPSPCPRTP